MVLNMTHQLLVSISTFCSESESYTQLELNSLEVLNLGYTKPATAKSESVLTGLTFVDLIDTGRQNYSAHFVGLLHRFRDSRYAEYISEHAGFQFAVTASVTNELENLNMNLNILSLRLHFATLIFLFVTRASSKLLYGS